MCRQNPNRERGTAARVISREREGKQRLSNRRDEGGRGSISVLLDFYWSMSEALRDSLFPSQTENRWIDSLACVLPCWAVLAAWCTPSSQGTFCRRLLCLNLRPPPSFHALSLPVFLCVQLGTTSSLYYSADDTSFLTWDSQSRTLSVVVLCSR